MPRARLLKPGFFKNEDLARLPFATRLCYAGLWTLADREGRLEDRPDRIKVELFPYDRTISTRDVRRMLAKLTSVAFLTRYGDGNGHHFLAIPTFLQHQTPHHREPLSRIPAPPTGSLGPSLRPAQGQPTSGRAVTGDPVPVQPPYPPSAKGGRRGGRNNIPGAGGKCPHLDRPCQTTSECINRTIAENRQQQKGRA